MLDRLTVEGATALFIAALVGSTLGLAVTRALLLGVLP